MKVIVQKFGGTSVANPALIRLAAERAVEAQRQGHGVVMVVSAMAGETDRLLNLCNSFSVDKTEVDVVASTGETIVAALASMAVKSLGAKSRSFLGHQLPILTNSQASEAQILSVQAKPLLDSLSKGEIPVVAGFQGVDSKGRITTLGRGGSDTTAVAIAAAIPGSHCEIYTDVNGVYTADPRTMPMARQLPNVSYEFMIEASSLGAKVMHDRSVMLGLRYGVPIQVKSTFEKGIGTLIGKLETHSRCVAIGKKGVSVVGDFIKGFGNLEKETSKLLASNGIPCLQLAQRPMSFTSVIPAGEALRAAKIFHRTFVEQTCN